jgi:hypothetical protein
MLEADEICTICGGLIRTHRFSAHTARFLARAKNRFFYGPCNACQKRVNEERRTLGLEEKRGVEMLKLYAKARYLLEREEEPPELNHYVGWMNDLLGAAIARKLFEEYRSPVAELGRLEQTTSQIVGARGIAPTLEYRETLKPFFTQIDRAQEKRKSNARKLYSRRKAGEAFGKPVDLLVFDILFDPF